MKQLGLLVLITVFSLPAFAEFGGSPFGGGWEFGGNQFGSSANYGQCMYQCAAHPVGSYAYNQCFQSCTLLSGNGGYGFGGGGYGFGNGGIGNGNPFFQNQNPFSNQSSQNICLQNGGTHLGPYTGTDTCKASGMTVVGLVGNQICCRSANAGNRGATATNTNTNTNTNNGSNGQSCNSQQALQCIQSGIALSFCVAQAGCS